MEGCYYLFLGQGAKYLILIINARRGLEKGKKFQKQKTVPASYFHQGVQMRSLFNTIENSV